MFTPSLSLRFGSSYGLDLGASDPVRGNLRVRTFNDSKQTVGEIYKQQPCPAGFTRSDDLLEGMALRIKEAREHNLGALGADDAVESIVAFVPGQADLNKVVHYFANLKTLAGENLRKVDFSKLPDILRRMGVRVKSDCKVLVANDMVGGTAEAMHQIKQRYPELFRPGLSVFYNATGGGYGTAYCELDGHGVVRIRSAESQHLYDETSGKSLEAAGACREALVRNFLSRLDVDAKQVEKLAENAPGQIVDDYETAKGLVPGLTLQQFRNAANHAIGEYIDSLAKLSAIKVLEGVNRSVLSGPTVTGLKQFLEKNPEAFAADVWLYDAEVPSAKERPVIEKVFLSRVWQRLTDVGKAQYQMHGFDVITDISVPDNTLGARFLDGARPDGRGDRFALPGDALSN